MQTTPPTPTPSITAAQVLATLTVILGQLVSYGLIDNRREQLIGSIASVVIPFAWMLADAIIRHGRASYFSTLAGIAADQRTKDLEAAIVKLVQQRADEQAQQKAVDPPIVQHITVQSTTPDAPAEGQGS